MHTTTECKTCILKKICKHYKYFRDNEDILVEVKYCENHQQKAALCVESKATPVHINESYNPLQDMEKLYPDLKEMYTPPTTVNLATPVEISKAICDRCKKEVQSTDIDNCVECGRPVCRDCGVGALNDGKPEFTCEKCWSGTPDPDPNSTEEVTITYGDEKDEWDIQDFEEKAKEEEIDESRKQVDNGKSTRKSKKK